jgi:phasin family protein
MAKKNSTSAKARARGKAAASAAAKRSTELPGAAALDFTKLLEPYRLPGLDVSTLIERERKNIQALVEANKIALEGWQALIRRQTEILQDAMKQAFATAGQTEALRLRNRRAREAFAAALANMRELADMAAKSQKDAYSVVQKRIEENIEAARSMTKPK